jgi:UDP-N-acetylglucosamine--N-acetylmuramyl-(pentapeptide) pyrophosphoryl-undecaprenol N-acetylglucosamine transferase
VPTLFVATAGGHLTQLMDMADRLSPDVDDVQVWASNENAQSRSLLADRNAVFVPEVRAQHIPDILRSLPTAHRLHREWKFTRVVSTGAALALGYIPYLAARGVRAHYIESATRLAGPSMTGKLLRGVPGVRMYTQYERLADRRWHYAGCVFDRFVATKQTQPVVIRRAVVSLGTMTDFQFPRLLDAVVPLLRRGGLLEQRQGSPVETLWQTGSTPTAGLDIEAEPWVKAVTLDAAVGQADLVISHAGTGSALSALSVGRFPILLPRDDSRGEIGDRHQRFLAEELERRGIAMPREPEKLTVDDLLEAAAYRVESAVAPTPIALLD